MDFTVTTVFFTDFESITDDIVLSFVTGGFLLSVSLWSISAAEMIVNVQKFGK